jgi:hypothetical protein
MNRSMPLIGGLLGILFLVGAAWYSFGGYLTIPCARSFRSS